MLIMAPTVAMTDDARALKEIMQELRNNLIEISDEILTDNFDLSHREPRLSQSIQ